MYTIFSMSIQNLIYIIYCRENRFTKLISIQMCSIYSNVLGDFIQIFLGESSERKRNLINLQFHIQRCPHLNKLT